MCNEIMRLKVPNPPPKLGRQPQQYFTGRYSLSAVASPSKRNHDDSEHRSASGLATPSSSNSEHQNTSTTNTWPFPTPTSSRPVKRRRRSSSSSSHSDMQESDMVAANGTHSSDAHSHANGHSTTTPNGASKQRPPRDEEVVRIIIQALQDMGYKSSADLLQKESGFVLESSSVSQFRSGVLAGQWQQVEDLLPSLVTDSNAQQNVLFLLRRQKYLESLEKRDMKKALIVLRNELTPLTATAPRLHLLTSFLMCSGVDDLKKKAAWDGADGVSRHELLAEVQKHISSAVMIPERRLDSLLDQAIQLQKMSCMYHNTNEDNISLYTDHSCDRNEFPCETTHVLQEHSDEVWFVAFSHNGLYLASASKDNTAIIWSLEDCKPLHILTGHKDSVSAVAWSPDDSLLLTASNDHLVKLWNTKTAFCEQTLSRHTENVTSCAWLPDGDRFVSASHDKNIFMWNTDGDVLHRWQGTRVTDLVVTPDGKKMIAICHEKKIRLYDLETRTETTCIQETDSITSICVANDSRHVLVNLSVKEIHLWDLEERRLLKKFVGQQQGRFVIRSCFGGVNQNFILSGSEDNNVYVWHREHGVLIEKLSGHTGCVNSVAWNPRFNMFASASDDHTIRVFECTGMTST
ncbi:hypothetical protein SmJEL517_g03751 [Synchytrium microbalum]|uniref:CTLH domain-containing protein n=1 Tax=Synchytrium microbalum TaxID=1806994 RepID=A0A507C2R4_9FUNG|nr:uncharacterized protein SmJEL517_g03751 [Synchytrium microbalum]TPX33339.1 hypothetical protein SmJEL517_g03751 [Synchytrium microbalum]